ncbi:MAG: dynamin family protein [Syntrophales bacterium]|jgi:GTP-binding protein EngB required for normal cell division|nr:dynamin family protein [Syntrophales bacterium]MDD4339874.1 dynamin family protein [Syntrophales bacterium]HOG08196.1 dynamin family protein [Syntrophales bacterium]HOS76781.1 dynamin family protein [Syntrophales bacterium]HQN25683.1 dynamin family protein [Syntrophales bacterium]
MTSAPDSSMPDLLSDACGQLMARMRDAVERFQMISLRRPLDAAEALLRQNSPIAVAVLGQFKAGKSSFLNSLIGRTLLPVGVVPVTTVITRMQYGPKDLARVRFFDGANREIGLDSLADFTAEAKNPSNEKNIAYVDIELSGLQDYEGLCLVDTPGLGSVFQAHIRESENWLPEVGAALLAISADRPLSEQDLHLIRDLTAHTPRIVLLLTKSDLLDPDQQEEVVTFFQDTLQRELNRKFPVLLYSTRQETERFKTRLEMEVLLPLAANRDREFRNILKHKARSLARGCLGYLEIARKMSQQADQDRKGLRQRILDERVNYTLLQEELTVITRENSRQTRTFIMGNLNPLAAALREKLATQLKRDMATWTGNLWKLTRRYEDWLTENFTEEIGRISRTEQAHFMGTLKKAHASLDRSLASFRALLSDNIERVLGVRLAEADWRIEVAEPEHPDIHMAKTFDFHFDLLWFLIPMTLFRGLFERHFLKMIDREVEVNLSRLAFQWETRINAAMEEMRKQAERYIRDELTTIEALLSRQQGQTLDIEKNIQEIVNLFEKVK